MRFSVRFSLILTAFAVLCLFSAPSQSLAEDPSAPNGQAAPAQAPGTGTYVVTDPLANVRYDNKYDIAIGMAYAHMKAGPNLLEGSNLGGLDVMGSYWFSRRWGLEGSVRGYLGTSGAAPNPYDIRGPFVQEYFFTAGPEWLGPHNKHGALLAHVLVGGVYGSFEQDLGGHSPAVVGFYNTQVAPAFIVGGHIDLNRSPRWVFRVTPDANITRYSINYGTHITQTDVNFAISVGVQYKFKRSRF
jgi:hypothetical protein